MASLRRSRGVIAWVVSIALLGNLAAAMLCCVPNRAAASDYPTDLLVICTDHASGTTAAQDDLAPERSAKLCPLCSTPAAAAIVAEFATAFGRIASPVPQRSAFDFIATTADELRRPGLETRAPPLPA